MNTKNTFTALLKESATILEVLVRVSELLDIYYDKNTTHKQLENSIEKLKRASAKYIQLLELNDKL